MDQSHLHYVSTKTHSSPSFYLDQIKILTVDQCRYLGIAIFTNNSDVDLKRQMRTFYANEILLLRKFSNLYCSNLYCIPMWFDCTIKLH